jgi:hypothetical protein
MYKNPRKGFTQRVLDILFLTLPEDHMAKKIVKPDIPSLNLISRGPYTNTDTNLDLALKALSPVPILKRMGLTKRSGDSIEAIVYTLLLMPLLNLRSLCAFFDHRLPSVLKGGKDVVYHFIGNQSINWPLLVLKTVFKFFKLGKWGTHDGPVAFVVDDTLDRRYGKKVEAASLHWDHVLGKSVFGHQLLQLGLANTDGFLPLISHVFFLHA